MTLTETLKNANQQNRENIPSETLEVMDKATQDLIDNGLSNSALKSGDTFPSAILKNATGKEIKLDDLLTKGPVVISFYRGGWCPYCNIELKALQQALPQIKEAGANLVAITPETPDNSLTTKEKNNLSFEVLSDINNELAREAGLIFKLPKDLLNIYDNFGIDIEKHNKNADFELPMPATYVVDKNGKIIYAFVNEDYTKRADTSAILAALK
tara:strand:+ start:122 stop:760 length:639 start_codon:yes stop_codon:yes gene_type:complete